MMVRVGDVVELRRDHPGIPLRAPGWPHGKPFRPQGRVHELDLQAATATFYDRRYPKWPNPFTLPWRDLRLISRPS